MPPDAAGLAAAGLQPAQRLERVLQVFDALVGIETLEQLEGLLPLLVGLVGDLDPGFLAPEDVGTQRDHALRRKIVAHLAHRLVDAENFLDHQQTGAGPAGRQRKIGREIAVAAMDRDIGHGPFSLSDGAAVVKGAA